MDTQTSETAATQNIDNIPNYSTRDAIMDLAPFYDPNHKCNIVREPVFKKCLDDLRDRVRLAELQRDGLVATMDTLKEQAKADNDFAYDLRCLFYVVADHCGISTDLWPSAIADRLKQMKDDKDEIERERDKALDQRDMLAAALAEILDNHKKNLGKELGLGPVLRAKSVLAILKGETPIAIDGLGWPNPEDEQPQMTMTRKDQIKLWKAKIDSIVTSYRILDTACGAAFNAGTMDANGPLYTAIWKSFEDTLRMLDHDGWIAWFIFDNACGAKGLSASGKPITTTQQLAALIVD